MDKVEDCDEVWDLLNRYRTLRDANKDLMAQVCVGGERWEGGSVSGGGAGTAATTATRPRHRGNVCLC